MGGMALKSAASGAIFFATVSSLYFVHAAITASWTNVSSIESTSGATLSAQSWNQILGNLETLKNRVDTLDSKVAVLESPGAIAQIKTVQTRDNSTFSAPVSGNGTVITPLNIVMTPKKAGNMVILEWVVHGEISHNNNFLVARNGILLPNATNASNNRWAAVTTADFDNNDSSTPNEKVIRIVDYNSLSTESTYQLLVR